MVLLYQPDSDEERPQDQAELDRLLHRSRREPSAEPYVDPFVQSASSNANDNAYHSREIDEDEPMYGYPPSPPLSYYDPAPNMRNDNPPIDLMRDRDYNSGNNARRFMFNRVDRPHRKSSTFSNVRPLSHPSRRANVQSSPRAPPSFMRPQGLNPVQHSERSWRAPNRPGKWAAGFAHRPANVSPIRRGRRPRSPMAPPPRRMPITDNLHFDTRIEMRFDWFRRKVKFGKRVTRAMKRVTVIDENDSEDDHGAEFFADRGIRRERDLLHRQDRNGNDRHPVNSQRPSSTRTSVSVDPPQSNSSRGARKTVVRRSLSPEELLEMETGSEGELLDDSGATISSDPAPLLERTPSVEPSPGPPQPIAQALQIIYPTSLTKLPFLRRNLRASFHAAYVHSFVRRGRKPPTVPDPRGTPMIEWTYRIYDAGGDEFSERVGWTTTQTSWLCQLCPAFSAFSLGSALLFHLQRDHPEVEVIRKGRRLEVTILLDDSNPPSEGSVEIPEVLPTTTTTDEEGFLSDYESEETWNNEDDAPVLAQPTTASSISQARLLRDTMHAQYQALSRYRVGGLHPYDRVMKEVAHDLSGVEAQDHEIMEEDVVLDDETDDRCLAMTIIWGRWLAGHNDTLAFHARRNLEKMIDEYWEIIEETSSLEDLLDLLLQLRFARHISEDEASDLVERYRKKVEAAQEDME